jgi:hypothetical protein
MPDWSDILEYFFCDCPFYKQYRDVAANQSETPISTKTAMGVTDVILNENDGAIQVPVV